MEWSLWSLIVLLIIITIFDTKTRVLNLVSLVVAISSVLVRYFLWQEHSVLVQYFQVFSIILIFLCAISSTVKIIRSK